MEIIINEKKYNSETSTLLVDKGSGQALYRADGNLLLYRSAKGNLWGIFSYWSNNFGPQNRETFSGYTEARKYALMKCNTEEIERIFGAVEEV